MSLLTIGLSSIENNGESGSILAYDIGLSPFSSDIEQIDDFGYAWTQSSNDGMFNFEWIDISDNNEILSFDSNDSSTLIEMNFDFPFYNNSYNECLINPNGWIGFESDNTGWNNNSIFDDDSPRAAILAFWDDLNPMNAGNDVGEGYVRYHSNSDRLVIWYDHVIHWTSFDRIYDFQIVLYSDGKIDVNYREMVGNTSSATVGIMDSNGNYGLEVIYNQNNFIEDGMSVKFDTSPAWIDIEFDDNQKTISLGDKQLIINCSENDIDEKNDSTIFDVIKRTYTKKHKKLEIDFMRFVIDYKIGFVPK